VRFDAGYEPGNGRGVVGVWQFVFRRSGEVGTFRARVDAESGELLEFRDVNEYGSVTGGAFKGDRPAAETVMPMPFANYGSGLYANSAGLFSGTTGTTTLSGQYVGISPGGSEQVFKNGDRIEFVQDAIVLESLISKYLFGQGIKETPPGQAPEAAAAESPAPADKK